MDYARAKRILDAALSMNEALGAIDTAVSELTDTAENRAWASKLGEVLRAINEQLIRPIAREFPDLDPDR